MYSSYLGGGADDSARDVVVDASGNSYVTGNTQSAPFPTTEGAIRSTRAGLQDAFFTKVSASGVRLYSTMLGGSGNDFANGIAATADGSTYVTGKIAGLVTLSAYDEAKSERQRAFDLFGVLLDPVRGSPQTGNGDDVGFDIAVDAGGSAYVTGSTKFGAEPHFPESSLATSRSPRPRTPRSPAMAAVPMTRS